MFKRNALAATLIAAVSLGTARPAPAADATDIVGIIAGLAVLGIIAKEVEDRKGDRKSRAVERRDRQYYYRDNRNDRRWRYDSRKKRHSRAARILPEQCLRFVETRRGERRVLGKRCLIRNDVRVSRLPDRCAFAIDTRRGPREVYAARCLRRAGYEIGSLRGRRF